MLGSGEFGLVYAVTDHLRQELVAAKVLRRVEPGALARFKQEFRALADIRHPNLVRVMELHAAPNGAWFFTMERVSGEDPLTWLKRPQYAGGAVLTYEPASLPETNSQPDSYDAGPPNPPPTLNELDPHAVRAVFHQLVTGIGALHAAGFMHRDLKPSNVLVQPDGRVIVLDFGVARSLEDDRSRYSTAGTPRYMAPERWRGQPHGPASDWYALGVMLHEVLYGAAPCQTDAALPDLPPTAHAGLRAICARLLAPSAADRPSHLELLAAFAAEVVPEAPRRMPARLFVGRLAERQQLVDAMTQARAGARRTRMVLGPSGVGKSTLVRRALRDLRAEGPVVALAGRCHEHETLPFKALDGVIDALARHLDSLPADAARAVLPRHTQELAQVFPALRQVPAVSAWPATRLVEEPIEVRRRAFRALADLLGSLNDRAPVVLFIDDLQWGDEASAHLLIDVLSGLDAPAVLVIGACRTDERQDSPFMRVWDAWTADDPRAHGDVEVGRLTSDESLALSRHLLGDEGNDGDAWASTVAAESVGSPMLVEELVRAGRDGAPAGLKEVIGRRLDALSSAHLEVLYAVATAQRPLLRELLWDATDLGDTAWAVVDDLVDARLLLRRPIGGRPALEVRHDRYREVVAARLAPEEARRVQRALADAGARQGAEADWVAARYEMAGCVEQALPHARRAAEEALASLSLERAAELFAQALRCTPPGDVTRGPLLEAQANALALVGRSAEASLLYLDAAEVHPDPLRMRYKASIQQMFCGQTEAGVTQLRGVSEALGVGWPRRPWQAAAGMVWTSFRMLGWRAPAPALTGPAELPPTGVSPVELCWEACQALSSSDWIRGAWFAAQGAHHAMRSGDPVRIARSMAWLGSQVQPFSSRQSERALELAKRIATTHPHPELLAVIDIVEATRWLTSGEFAPAAPLFDRCIERLQTCEGSAWLGMLARSLQGETLIHLGELPRLRLLIDSAQHRYWELGNLHGAQVVRLQEAVLRMSDDQPDRAHVLLERVDQENTKEGFFYLHYGQMENAARLSLYQGDLEGAARGLMERWPRMMASGIAWVPSVASRAWSVRGNIEAARLAASHGTDASARAVVREALSKLARTSAPVAVAEHRQLSGALAAAEGRRADAVRLATEAAACFRGNHQHLRAAIAARGAAIVGEGDTDAAARAVAALAISAPAAWSRAFSPAFEAR